MAHPVTREGSRRGSPSRWRFCPLSPLTFRFRVRPSGGASTYSRSVLGASRNLCTQDGRVKTLRNGFGAFCDVSRTEWAFAPPASGVDLGVACRSPVGSPSPLSNIHPAGPMSDPRSGAPTTFSSAHARTRGHTTTPVDMIIAM